MPIVQVKHVRLPGARLEELDLDHDAKTQKQQKPGRGPPGTQAPPGQVPGDTANYGPTQDVILLEVVNLLTKL